MGSLALSYLPVRVGRAGVPGLMAIVALLSVAAPVRAAIPGFTEDFNEGIGSFFSGAALVHETSGGVGGAGDGYIWMSRSKPDHLGVAAAGVEFTGNLIADGVTGFSFWLNDVGDDDDLEIHVGVGNAFGNFWLHTVGIAPPHNQWAPYTVDFSNPAEWVLIRGAGTFEEALANSDRLLFRHDLAPYEWFPDAIAAGFALDRVTVLPEPAVVVLIAVGAVITALRARRRD